MCILDLHCKFGKRLTQITHMGGDPLNPPTLARTACSDDIIRAWTTYQALQDCSSYEGLAVAMRNVFQCHDDTIGHIITIEGILNECISRRHNINLNFELDPRLSDLVFPWRAWFMTTTWGRIEVEPTLLGVDNPQSYNDLQPSGISICRELS